MNRQQSFPEKTGENASSQKKLNDAFKQFNKKTGEV